MPMKPPAECHIRVRRSARYHMFGAPSPLVRDVWLVCHGYAQLSSRFVESFRVVRSESRLIVAPEALSRFYLSTHLPHTPESRVGAIWMTRVDREREIEDQVGYLDTLYDHLLGELAHAGVQRDMLRVRALGFSQGAAVVSRWVARGAAHVDQLILWGSGVPRDVNLRAVHERWPAMTLDVVYGEGDQWIRPDAVAEQTTLYRTSGMPFHVRTFEGGHVMDDGMLAKLAAEG